MQKPNIGQHFSTRSQHISRLSVCHPSSPLTSTPSESHRDKFLCRLLIVSPITRLVYRGQKRGVRSRQGQYPLQKHHRTFLAANVLSSPPKPSVSDDQSANRERSNTSTTSGKLPENRKKNMPCPRFCKSSGHNHHEGHTQVHRPPSWNQERCFLQECVKRLTHQHTCQVNVKHRWQFQQQRFLAYWTNQQTWTEYFMKMVITSYKYIPVMVIVHPVVIWAHFLSLARSKLRLCSANHRAGYFSNLACDWLSIVWAYSEQETENGPWYQL